MIEKFNEHELDIAKEIFNIGLSKAADSMAFFTKEKVFIKSLDLKMKDVKSIDKLSRKNEDELLYVLTTEVKGELEGVCYLVFSEKEVEEILKVSLPSSIIENPAKCKLMSEAILLEMDNIIAASVITQFSNFFKYKIYGDVPSLLKTSLVKFNDLVKTDDTFKYVLYFKSEFNTTGMGITPEFIWLLDDKYIEGVKSIAQDAQRLKEINEELK